MLFCLTDFVVQIGPKLLCVSDDIAGCLARQKTQLLGANSGRLTCHQIPSIILDWFPHRKHSDN